MTRTIPVRKNDYIDVVFEDLTHDGAGVAKVDGYPLFVPNGLPGEKAQVKVIKVNKGYGFGRLIELYAPAARADRGCAARRRADGPRPQPGRNRLIDLPAWVAEEVDVAKVAAHVGDVPLARPMAEVFDGQHEVFEVPIGAARPVPEPCGYLRRHALPSTTVIFVGGGSRGAQPAGRAGRIPRRPAAAAHVSQPDDCSRIWRPADRHAPRSRE